MDPFEKYKKQSLMRRDTKEYKDEDYEMRYSRNNKIRAFDKMFESGIATKLEWKSIKEVDTFEDAELCGYI